MSSSVSRVLMSPEVSGVLSMLAQHRGFLLEHELFDSHDENGDEVDEQVPVLSMAGETLGLYSFASSQVDGPMSVLQNLPPSQSSEERHNLLARLESIEAQALGWLLSHPIVSEALLCVVDGVRESLENIQATKANWSSSLLPIQSEHEVLLLSGPLIAAFTDAGLERLHRSELIREGAAHWRISRLGEGAVATESDQAIEDWVTCLNETRAQLLEGNLRLVATVAARHQRQMGFNESLRAGLVGFSRALDIFDIQRGTQLSTYATWWIRQAVTRAVADHGNPIRLPVHVQENIVKFISVFRRTWQPRISSLELLEKTADSLDTPLEQVALWASFIMPTLPVTQSELNSSFCIQERLFDPSADPGHALIHQSYIAQAQTEITTILKHLENEQARTLIQQKSDRNIDVVKRRLGVGMPKKHELDKIGQDYGVTRERIRQIEAEAFNVLRKRYGARVKKFLAEATGGLNG